MGKECIAFQIQDAKEAMRHMNCDIVKDYGDYAYGHPLYCWDDGFAMERHFTNRYLKKTNLRLCWSKEE